MTPKEKRQLEMLDRKREEVEVLKRRYPGCADLIEDLEMYHQKTLFKMALSGFTGPQHVEGMKKALLAGSRPKDEIALYHEQLGHPDFIEYLHFQIGAERQ